MLASTRLCATALLAGAAVAAACGGKTVTDLDSGSSTTPPATPPAAPPEAGPPTVIDAGGRVCPSECAVAHQCCKGGCGGLPVAMPNGCCSCLPGETDSTTCSSGKCGG